MNPREAWHSAYNQLELQLDRPNFDTWVRQTTFLRYEDGVFVIGVGNSYARDMLQHRLYRNIRRVLSDVCGEPVEILFELYKDDPVVEETEQESGEMPLFQFLAQQEQQRPENPLHHYVRPPQRPALPESELNPRYTFDRFIINASNQVVFEAACAVAEYPATVYNPFLVYGGVGLGKTHILQAIAHACQQRGLRTVYVPSEAFTNDLIAAIRNRTTAMFREKYRQVDVLLVDDIQFIGGKDTTQEEFFHTFNALVNFNKQIVLASDRHPRELKTLEDRLRSRFQGGLVADIQPPEFETRLAILDMWAREKQLEMSYDALRMVAERAPANIREMEGAFNRVAAQARIRGNTPMTANGIEQTLERFARPRYRVTMDRIISVVAEQHNLRPQDLTGKRRTGRINQARQIAMYLTREMTEYSLPQIGEAFGGRSHTTVLHGCNKMVEELACDDILNQRVDLIQQIIARGT